MKTSERCLECGSSYRPAAIEQGCSAVCRRAIADSAEAQHYGERNHP
jgi:hypothetical protein